MLIFRPFVIIMLAFVCTIIVTSNIITPDVDTFTCRMTYGRMDELGRSTGALYLLVSLPLIHGRMWELNNRIVKQGGRGVYRKKTGREVCNKCPDALYETQGAPYIHTLLFLLL